MTNPTPLRPDSIGGPALAGRPQGTGPRGAGWVLAAFYLFAAILVLAALGLITARNPVYSALALVMCFITSAAIWLLIEAEFLAIVLVLVRDRKSVV